MSMIRDLRAVVRPSAFSLRKDGGTYKDPTRDPAAASAVVDCAVYRDGTRVETDVPLTPHTAMRQVRRDGGFVLIGLHEPTEAEFAGIARVFGLHPLAVEDAIEAHQRPKVERYDESPFAVFEPVRYVDHDGASPPPARSWTPAR
ncbi:magnesium and cobalt transport protein CorA [Streptomyces californicus]